ncbi:MICOS complex subunit mic19 [Colletotrichum chlorophyti]|uniref:MICOS complex subunit mic19 n=1 Tax=Colletotrichum chlorophyti TaxID=708187 RepID=A0A1Q8S567_9PEZI|nr:MICOS complex subunit mic19 [Colletotrichum chlorophyti]
MGASESKPSSNTPPHLWKAPQPHGISHDLVESLQNSHETDASRAQLSELQIQARVAEELKRLQAQESEALKLAHEKIAAEEKPTPEGQRSHESVAKEIEALRAKLAERKKIRDLPEGVETARSNVVRCLRENDRRPLDCWKEVEAFKEEVKRLEKGWVEKVVS